MLIGRKKGIRFDAFGCSESVADVEDDVCFRMSRRGIMVGEDLLSSVLVGAPKKLRGRKFLAKGMRVV